MNFGVKDLMKKLIALVATVTVCLTMSATVFAAGSPVAPPVNTPTPTPTMAPVQPVPGTTITIDDVPVTPDDVTENPDGTVTLSDDIIRALDLGPGEHTIVFTFPDGTTRRYTITLGGDRTPETTPETAPQTSDLLIVPGLAVVALAGTTTAVVAKKKQS